MTTDLAPLLGLLGLLSAGLLLFTILAVHQALTLRGRHRRSLFSHRKDITQ